MIRDRIAAAYKLSYNTAVDKLKTGAKKLGLSLTDGQLEQFEVYYREIAEWNKRVNLTSITGYEEAQVNHFLDSLTVTLAMPPDSKGLRIIDIGTGAGLPGIPLKIVFPGIKLTLLEATGKKIEFIRHISDKLELDEVEIIKGRAEETARLEEYRESYDIVLSRAVAEMATLAELTLPFCKTGGICIAQKKGGIRQELEEAEKAVNVLGGKVREVKNIPLEEFADKRCLVIIDKVSATPDKYPRRPGIPAKRPIK